MTNYKIIYAKPMYEFLAVNGILPVETIPKFNNPRFLCWVYENTKQLQQTMRKYKKSLR